MSGTCYPGASNGGPGAAERLPQEPLAFRLTITADDLERFLDEPEHSARAEGWIDAASIGGRRQIQRGWFNLFAPTGEPDRRLMWYRLHFEGAVGQPRTLIGWKNVWHGALTRIWPDTSTLYFRLLAGHVAPERGRPGPHPGGRDTCTCTSPTSCASWPPSAWTGRTAPTGWSVSAGSSPASYGTSTGPIAATPDVSWPGRSRARQFPHRRHVPLHDKMLRCRCWLLPGPGPHVELHRVAAWSPGGAGENHQARDAGVSGEYLEQAVSPVGRADQPHVKSHGLSNPSVVWATGTGPRATIVSPASGAGAAVCVTAASCPSARTRNRRSCPAGPLRRPDETQQRAHDRRPGDDQDDQADHDHADVALELPQVEAQACVVEDDRHGQGHERLERGPEQLVRVDIRPESASKPVT